MTYSSECAFIINSDFIQKLYFRILDVFKERYIFIFLNLTFSVPEMD